MGSQDYRVKKLIREVEENRLEVKSFFQRRQVWTDRDKEYFIDTVLKNYPFPEIFIAESTGDRKSLECRTWLVDGKQRVTTLIDYFKGAPLNFKDVPPFDKLTPDQQDDFLAYEVAVRDLGPVSEDQIREMFGRINATDYALKTMEKLNAMFSGKYIQYSEQLSRHRFFEYHNIFPYAYKKRMYDVTFCVILVTTVLSDYYRRDERNKEFLERYNDEFPQQEKVDAEIEVVFNFVESCGFGERSRAWKQTDLLTLLVELHKAIAVDGLMLDPATVGAALRNFYNLVDEMYRARELPEETEVPSGQEAVFKYLKAVTKASNDKYARIDRAEVISSVIRSTAGDESKLDRSASTISTGEPAAITPKAPKAVQEGKPKRNRPIGKTRTKKPSPAGE
jgi:Protein of unknown function DUF262